MRELNSRSIRFHIEAFLRVADRGQEEKQQRCLHN